MKLVLTFLMLFVSFESYTQEKSNAFVIKIYSNRVKVLSPDKGKSNVHAIVENNTLVDVTGKIIKSNGVVLTYLRVESGKTRSYLLELGKSEQASFIPMAPSFQEVALIYGKKSYEVPSKE